MLWDSETGDCLQRLDGHSDEIFSCQFSYDGRLVLTGSKDNTCRLWSLDGAAEDEDGGR